MSRRTKTPVPERVIDVDAFETEIADYVAEFELPRGLKKTGVRKKDRDRLFVSAVRAVGGVAAADSMRLLPTVTDHITAVCPAYGVDPQQVFCRPAALFHAHACERCDTDSKKHASWKLITRVGRLIDPASYAIPSNPYLNGSSTRPYFIPQLSWFKNLVASLEPGQRLGYEVAFYLSLLFGVDAEAVAYAHADDFRPIKGGSWTFTPSTGPTRTIPSPIEDREKIGELVAARRGRYMLPTPDGRVPSPLAARAALRPLRIAQAGVETPAIARLASTWRWHRFLTGLHPLTITTLSGRSSLDWLRELPQPAGGITLDDFDLAQTSPADTQLAIPFHQTKELQ